MPSSVIRSFSYDAARRELHVRFQTDKAYDYFGVPERIYTSFRAASSKGEFFNRYIRGKFDFVRR